MRRAVNPRPTSQKNWRGFLYRCMECTGPRNEFELISTVKMETRFPTEGSFGNNFRQSMIIAELWRSEVAKIFKFLRFCRKTTPYWELFKILFRKDSSRHWSTCCVHISWNSSDGKSVKSCVAYRTKKNKISPGSPSLATARIALKICQSQPPRMYSECSMQISSKSVHFRRSYSRTRKRRQRALGSESKIRLKPSFSSFEPNKYARPHSRIESIV